MTTRRLRFLALSSAVLASAIGATTVHAQNSCEPFTLKLDMSQRSVEYLDLGASGVTPGDFRVGRAVLVDEGGNEAGIMRWVTRSLDSAPGADEGSQSLGDYVLLLNDGHLHWRAVAETLRPPDNVDTTSVGALTGAILGGTGAYSQARGSVDVSRDDGVTLSIDITCD